MNIQKLTNSTPAEELARGYSLRVWSEPSTGSTHGFAYFPLYLGNYGRDVEILYEATAKLKRIIREYKKQNGDVVPSRLEYEIVQCSTTAENLIRSVELRALPTVHDYARGLQRYAIQWENGDGEIVCEPCGIEWAEKNGLINEHGQWFENDHAEDPHGRSLYVDAPWHDVESDTPEACSTCGAWLDVRLMPEAIEYMNDHEFPHWIRELYGV